MALICTGSVIHTSGGLWVSLATCHRLAGVHAGVLCAEVVLVAPAAAVVEGSALPLGGVVVPAGHAGPAGARLREPRAASCRNKERGYRGNLEAPPCLQCRNDCSAIRVAANTWSGQGEGRGGECELTLYFVHGDHQQSAKGWIHWWKRTQITVRHVEGMNMVRPYSNGLKEMLFFSGIAEFNVSYAAVKACP